MGCSMRIELILSRSQREVQTTTLRTPLNVGAGEGVRTLDIYLGKVVLYQLSYTRIEMHEHLYLIRAKLFTAQLGKAGVCRLHTFYPIVHRMQG